MAKDYLFEIGTEEIPARFMVGALEELKQKAKSIFEQERMVFSEINTYGTPRRLTLYVSDLEEISKGLVEEKKGPAVKVAFDVEGNFTKAAQGFARGQKVSVDDLIVKETPGGKYVFAVVEKKGKNVRDILPQILPELILSLDFPKPMRWGYSNIRFIRPIRWLVSLYGEEVIPIKVEDIEADRFTCGHRFLSGDKVNLSSASDYFTTLQKEYVIIDQKKREEIIWQQIKDLAVLKGGIVKQNPQLLEEINYLVEYPTALCGNFAETYLELPDEVLITVMKEHQKYFPVWDREGNLMAKFITVRNGDDKYLDIVAQGNEKVLEARLNDGKFFYAEDIKKPLETKLEQLKYVVFQEKLGTMYQKVQRIKKLTAYIADKLGLSPKAKENALRAAYLAKADLVSNMVYEFPELQGIMGYYYALHFKEDKDVALAIKEHYQPRFSGDEIPLSTVGSVVAIADKIDTVAGCFAVGIKPTGSGDPYGLRRQAQGICLILVESNLEINIFDLIEETLLHFQEQDIVFDLLEAKNGVKEFFKQRLANLMEEKGIGYDVVNCILESDWNNMAITVEKAKSLIQFKANPHYGELITAYTRAGNLAKNAVSTVVNENLFKEEAEKLLWEQFNITKTSSKSLYENQLYEDFLEEFSNLKPYIDNFFDKVMVMDNDESVKNNRLALLKNIVEYLKPFGDLSKLMG